MPRLADMDKSAVVAWLGSLDTLALVCIAFVAIGVVGEFAVHFLYSRATRRLESLSDQEHQLQETEVARLKNETAQLTVESLALMQASRDRSFVMIGNQGGPFWELKQFAGTELFVQSSEQEEPRNFAKGFASLEQIGFILKWPSESQTQTVNIDGATLMTWLPKGMTVQNGSAPRPLGHEPKTKIEAAYAAAEALTSYLRLTGVICRHFAFPHNPPADMPASLLRFSELPEGAILITIGRRPEPAELAAKYMRDMAERLAKDKSKP